MGRKVNPLCIRIGINEGWRSRWYAGKQDYGMLLVEDQGIRGHIKSKYGFAGIPRVDIERTREEVRVFMYCMRPGVIIGRKGAEIENLRVYLEEMTGRKVNVKIREIPRPELSAQLVAEGVGEQLRRRGSFKRALKKAAELTMEAGAYGVRMRIAGRLGGSEMARCEQISMGSIPLSTFRAKLDYGFANVVTNYGCIGVKCWIYLGEVDENGVSEVEAKVATQAPSRGGFDRSRGPGGSGRGRGRRRSTSQREDTRTRSGVTRAAGAAAPQAPEARRDAPAAETAAKDEGGRDESTEISAE